MTALLKLVASQPAASALRSASAPDTPACVLNVLVAEDNVVNQRVAQGLLKTLGHRVTVVSDGSEALARIEEQPFDLVFMDVQMPKMDGITATEHIRRGEVERQRHVPIIAMTAHALSGDRERLLDCGMDDYVSKPISLEMLRRAIERAVSRPARFDESMKENLVPHNT
jgi:CheY-like chemotaxis protein